jgi:hypothetical protein
MEPKFVIQGVDYEVPSWMSFTLDESEILSAKTGMTLDQIDEDIKISPGLLSTMMIVAYMRGNPNVTRARAEKIIGGIKLVDAIEHLATGEDDADVPPSVTPTPDEPENASESTTFSGGGSLNDSASLAVLPTPTGTSESDTSDTFAQATSGN